jgi:hypothetical protein
MTKGGKNSKKQTFQESAAQREITKRLLSSAAVCQRQLR